MMGIQDAAGMGIACRLGVEYWPSSDGILAKGPSQTCLLNEFS